MLTSEIYQKNVDEAHLVQDQTSANFANLGPNFHAHHY